MRIFIGYDTRQPLAFSVLSASIAQHASVAVSITPLTLKSLPVKRRGLTDFTYSRFLVPYLCGYKGTSLFLDADMLVTADLKELFGYADPFKHDVHVMKEQARFEWPSAMLFNCGRCTQLTPEYVADLSNNPLDLKWAKSIGDFPEEWNRCVGYSRKTTPAKLYHFTQGIPCWPETQKNPEDELWFKAFEEANYTVSYEELMGGSVHAVANAH